MNATPAVSSSPPKTEGPPPASEGSRTAEERARQVWRATAHFRPVLVLTVLLFAYFAATQGIFLQGQNLEDLLTGVSVLWVVSIGMTFVLLTGGVDLSVGAIGALIAILLAKLLALGLPGGLVILIACSAGTIVGLGLNGILIGKVGLSFFVVTLATMTALGGIVALWSGDNTVFVTNPTILKIGSGNIAGIQTPIWIMAATLIIALYVQRRTFYGRNIYAVGGSIVAARLSGIRTSRVVVSVYGVSGLCAAVGGVIAAGRIAAASPTPDNNLALQAAAAVLLGGTTLAGGSGGVGGTMIGVLFIGVLQNGLSIAGVASFWQEVITGVILVAAVLGDRITTAGGWTAVRAAWRYRQSSEDRGAAR